MGRRPAATGRRPFGVHPRLLGRGRLAPDWESWDRTRDFPMGLALGPALVIYLGLGALYGV